MNYICILLQHRACKTPLGVRVETGGPILFSFLNHTFIFHIFYFNKSPIILWGHSMKVFNCLFFFLFMSALSLLASTGITQPDSVLEYEIDAMPVSLDLGLEPGQMVYQYNELTISCRIKNNGTYSLGPVPLTLCITVPSRNGQTDTLYIKNDQSPPLLSGDSSGVFIFSFTVYNYLTTYNISVKTLYNGDENPANDCVDTSIFVYPRKDNFIYLETFQDTTFTGFPVNTPLGSYYTDWSANGWTAFDSTDTEQQDFINSWHLDKNQQTGEIKAMINNKQWSKVPENTNPSPRPQQYQNEILYSPVFDITEYQKHRYNEFALVFTSKITGTQSHDCPFYACVELTVDNGDNWLPVKRYIKEIACSENNINHNKIEFIDITYMLGKSDSVQFRFWWRQSFDTGEPASWSIDNFMFLEFIFSKNVQMSTNSLQLYNYPNPFNPQTTIQYRVEKDAHTKLTIYDILGREIITLVDKQQTAGIYTIPWNSADASGNRVPSGVYFYKLVSGNQSQIRKMTLVH